jgi:hypothetical protein
MCRVADDHDSRHVLDKLPSRVKQGKGPSDVASDLIQRAT